MLRVLGIGHRGWGGKETCKRTVRDRILFGKAHAVLLLDISPHGVCRCVVVIKNFGL